MAPNVARSFKVSGKNKLLWFTFLLIAIIGCAATTLPAFAETAHLRLRSTVPAGTVGIPYHAEFWVSGGSAPYSFQVMHGSLPSGLALDPNTGRISGVPASSGRFDFGILVSDASNHRGDKGLSLYISSESTVPPSVAVSPVSATVSSGGTQQFVATVSNTPNTAVSWSASSGSISANGLFTAPSVSSTSSVNITATLKSAPAVQASALVTVNPVTGPSPLAITTFGLPSGMTGSAYSAALSASGGTAPYSWSLTSGSLPAGIQLSQSGFFSGTPSQSGNSSLTVRLADSTGNSVTQVFSLTISAQTSGSNYDGPAELPRVYIQSTMADTPAPGTSVFVSAGGNLQSALSQANCGDTIQLQAGATYSGVFTFPAKNCDDNHWIIVRTSAPDSSLPAEGTRLTPCYAGVSSLPARPAFNCTSTQNVMAKLVFRPTTTPQF